MSDWNPWWVGGVAAGLVLLGLGGRWLWHLARAVMVERARELFRLQHERYEEQLVAAAAETGKPRGLRWVGCRIIGDAVLARELGTRRIFAFVPVVIMFEPVEGSDMEENPAATEPRPASAVFTFSRGEWITEGRIVFNLDPHQALGRFGPKFQRTEHH